MHTLDDVATVVKHSSNVFRVDGTREVRVAVVPAVRYRDFLHKNTQLFLLRP